MVISDEEILKDLGITPKMSKSSDEQVLADLGVSPISTRKPVVAKKSKEDLLKKIEDIRHHPLINTLIGAGYGIGETLENLLTGVTEATKPISKKLEELQPEPLPEFPIRMPSITERLPKPAPTISGALGELAGKIGGAMLLPAGRAAPGAGLLQRAAVAVPSTAAFGAIEMPERPVTGALIGTAAAPVGEVAAAALGKTVGVSAGLVKSVIESPTFRKAKKVIKSGMTKDLYPYIEERINTIRNSLSRGSTEATSNRDVFDRVQRHYSEASHEHFKIDPETGKKIPHDLYKEDITTETAKYIRPEESVGTQYEKAKEMSKEFPYEFNRKSFDIAIDKSINNLDKELTVVKESPHFRAPVEESIKVLKSLKKMNITDFESADIAKRKINDLLFKGDTTSTVRGILGSAKEGLRKSVKETYKPHPELSKIWENADKRFVEELMPFREFGKEKSQFMKMYEKLGVNVDNFVNKYIIPGRNDLLDNFLKIVPDEETRDIAAFDFFKNYGRQSTLDNPEAFMKQYSKLNPYQRKKLTPDYYNELNELEKLYKKAPIAFKPLKEPAERISRKRLALSEKLAAGGLIGGVAGVPYSPHLAMLGLTGLLSRGVGRAIKSIHEASLSKFMETPEGREAVMSALKRIGEKEPTTRLPTYPILGALGRVSAFEEMKARGER